MEEVHFWTAQALLQNIDKLWTAKSSLQEQAAKIRTSSWISLRKEFLWAIHWDMLFMSFLRELWHPFSPRIGSFCFSPHFSCLLLFHRSLLQDQSLFLCSALRLDTSRSSLALLALSSLCFFLHALHKAVSVLSKNLVMAENHLSLRIISSGAQKFLVSIGVFWVDGFLYSMKTYCISLCLIWVLKT